MYIYNICMYEIYIYIHSIYNDNIDNRKNKSKQQKTPVPPLEVPDTKVCERCARKYPCGHTPLLKSNWSTFQSSDYW